MNNLILKSRIKKLIKNNNSREKTFLNLRDIQTILVLFDTEDYEQADAFIEQLEQMGKTATIYAYKGKRDEYDYSETPYHIIDHKEISGWFDNKLEEIVETLKKDDYDALFDLTIRENFPLEFLLVNANATLKVGYKKNKSHLYDLTISSLPIEKDKENSGIRELGKQIIYYLTTIKSV
jgi:hypothetical protein